MRRLLASATACALLIAAPAAFANPTVASGARGGALPVWTGAVPKALSAQNFGARGTVTPSATMFGGFSLQAGGDVYIVVRGNSLGTLGITQAFLDAPRVRLFNAQGQDLITDASANPGFNACVAGTQFGGPVVDYYQNVRNAPVHLRDACLAVNLPAGVYTFSVTPSPASGANSVPSSGEVLFEINLDPL